MDPDSDIDYPYNFRINEVRVLPPRDFKQSIEKKDEENRVKPPKRYRYAVGL